MTSESNFIQLMQAIATSPDARGLMDDAAVITIGHQSLVITHDMMAQGVHWSDDANPRDVAWKIVAVNLSDLAAKGARPIGVLLGFSLGDSQWDAAFAAGLSDALAHYNVALLGGDTVSITGSNRCIGITALGVATHTSVPARSGARDGDIVYVTGTLGDAKAGFDLSSAGKIAPIALLNAFNRPAALIAEGIALVPIVSAIMDVSDGLLLDVSRMAEASAIAIDIDLSAIPLSSEYAVIYGDTLDSRMAAATWGDDYQLLFCAPPGAVLPFAATAIGRCTIGFGLRVNLSGSPIELPAKLGFEH
jgi:thiamine-monophosphate kinase